MLHVSCDVEFKMQLAEAALAVAAAAFWLWSAWTQMPNTDASQLQIGDLGEISKAFARQNVRSAIAAACAGVAALLQAALVYAPSCFTIG